MPDVLHAPLRHPPLIRVRSVGSDRDEEQVVRGIRQHLRRAVAELAASGARDEALARLEIPRRLLFIQRSAVFVPVARVWRLGVFLLDHGGTLYETAAITRAVEPGYPGYQSVSAEERKAVKAAALKGGFVHGETLNYDAAEVVLEPEVLRHSSGSLFIEGDRALVRWSRLPNVKPVDFGTYLGERVDVLVHPPEGA